eukprot:4830232-Amphidinium_carterae.1
MIISYGLCADGMYYVAGSRLFGSYDRLLWQFVIFDNEDTARGGGSCKQQAQRTTEALPGQEQLGHSNMS